MPSCTEATAAKTETATAIPLLKVTNDTSHTNLRIDKLHIDVKVTGNIATTTFDIDFYNPLDKILEGEFDFPLADGQNIVRYALDINGELREGVVVEKLKARVAFENTVRRNVDPGLVEKTQGNNFRTRIYPIPAKGYKRVVIGVEQPLASTKDGLIYTLPLFADQTINEFILTATVYKTKAAPSLQNNGLSYFAFDKSATGWEGKFETKNFTANQIFEFVVPENGELVYTEKFEGKTYFYVHSQVAPEYRSKPNPATIALLWDASASSEKRNIDKEIDIITAYFTRLQNVTVDLVPFSVTAQAGERFVISGGDASGLIKRIKALQFDGGTQLGAIDMHQYNVAEILMFTDGLSTFGKSEIVLSATPITVVNSSSAPDYSYLKYIALQTQGKFIDLNTINLASALNEMVKEPLQFINATFNVTDINSFASQTSKQLQNGFSFAGILNKPSAAITLNFGYGNKVITSKTITIKDDQIEAGNVKRIWATTQIAQLDLQSEKYKDEITKLGKQFSVVTRNTSLLVLDRIEDYVQYEIVPPASMQKEYYVLLKAKLGLEKDAEKEAVDDAVLAMDEMKEWYHQKKVRYTKGTVEYDYAYAPPRVEAMQSANISSSYTAGLSATVDSVAAPQVNGNYNVGEEQNKAKEVTFEEIRAPEPPKIEIAKFTPPTIVKDEEVKEDETSPISEIEITQWKSDAVYLKELEKVPADKQYQKYLSIKKDYISQPAFFVDVARFFFEKKNKALAVQILSNIVEMKLENPELLRIVANQLMEFGEPDLAVEVFKKVLDIREEEPQSYRDLGLAYNEVGKYQEAIDLLYKVILGTWDSRFGSVKAIALNEMNSIISAHTGGINISKIDKRFIAPMPMDVRIVIGWSSNDSDVDLWVTDPAKEKCFYENNTTSGGGKISGDVTQGYGPEEYCVRKAKNGIYYIDVNLYGDSRQTSGGPITMKAELFTNFGTPNQQRKVINCRVTSSKEVVRIGSLDFKKQ